MHDAAACKNGFRKQFFCLLQRRRVPENGRLCFDVSLLSVTIYNLQSYWVTFIHTIHKVVEKFNNYFMNFKALLIIIIVAFALLWIRAI